MKTGTKLATILIMAGVPQLVWALAPVATDSVRVALVARNTLMAAEPSAKPPSMAQLHMKLRGSAVRAKVRELVLYVDRTEATVALEVENSSGEVLSMAVASLMLGACQTHNSSFRGLANVSHKTPADVMKFSGDELRRVEPGEKFLISIKTGTYDLTCRTLAQAQQLDVSLDLWVFNGKEGARVPLRVPAQIQVAR